MNSGRLTNMALYEEHIRNAVLISTQPSPPFISNLKTLWRMERCLRPVR